jgi:hypothetical protein
MTTLAESQAPAVTSRFPDARLDREPVFKPNLTLRGMSTLAVTV